MGEQFVKMFFGDDGVVVIEAAGEIVYEFVEVEAAEGEMFLECV